MRGSRESFRPLPSRSPVIEPGHRSRPARGGSRGSKTSITFVVEAVRRQLVGGLLSAYVRREACWPRTGMRRRPPSFRRFSIIVRSWARIPSVHWRTCNSTERSRVPEIAPSRRLPPGISSTGVRTLTPTSRSSRRPKWNTSSCSERRSTSLDGLDARGRAPPQVQIG
jgi:hypothetical protein